MATAGLDAVKFAPRRVLLSLVLLLTGGIGYLTSEVKNLRFGKDSGLEANVLRSSQILSETVARVSALEVRVSAQEGTSERIENKVDKVDGKVEKVDDKVDVLLRRSR